jgi:hypothetical protein
LESIRGQKKNILGLRRNSLIRRPLNFYSSPKEEGLGVDEALLKGLIKEVLSKQVV